MKREHFIEVVEDSLDSLPQEFRSRVQNVAILVEDSPPKQPPVQPGQPRQLLLGIFHGVPATRKSVFDLSAGPDHIVLYQKNIEAVCSSDAEVRHQIRQTLIHELGHYFGMTEEQLRDDEHFIELSKLDIDPTNPGSHPLSHRYQKREQPIHDSYDILGRIIYPLVVCTIDDGSGHFLLIDGHGRFDEAKKRGQKQIKCIVFPPLTVEQRIILRQVLNAAQEPFDAPLILRDLQTLAKERNLDIRNNDADMDALLEDFPESFAAEKKKLRVLAAWPEDIADKISIDVNKKSDEGDEQGVIGYAKINQLNVLLNKLKNHHPNIVAQYPGQKLHRQLLKLYFDNIFRDGSRSQEGIANANRVILHAETNEPLISEFLKGGMKVGEFVAKGEAKRLAKEASEPPLVKLCNELKVILSGIYPPDLNQKERFALKSTNTVISEVLAEIAAAKN